jgi:hypothetical protein
MSEEDTSTIILSSVQTTSKVDYKDAERLSANIPRIGLPRISKLIDTQPAHIQLFVDKTN